MWEWMKVSTIALSGCKVKIIQTYGELIVGSLTTKPFYRFLCLRTMVLLIKPCQNIMAVKNLFNSLEAIFV